MVLLWLVLVIVKLPEAGSRGCWPAVSSNAILIHDVLPTACTDSWPVVALLLRVEFVECPQNSHVSSPFKKSYTLCMTRSLISAQQ